MRTARTKSAEDTAELAAAIAPLVRGGDLVLLCGELGAGKTTFAQGFGRGLGVEDPITSPTFTLMRPYRGRLWMLHCDLYRLDRLQEVIDLGISELVDGDSVALIEWGDVAEPVLPADFLEVRLTYEDDVDGRTLELRCVGEPWAARAAALAAAVDRWAHDGGP